MREGIRITFLGETGFGKSYGVAVIVEDALEQNTLVMIVEPLAEWHTLKVRYPNICVVGGAYADLPLNVEFAREYVRAMLEYGISMVFDLSDDAFTTDLEQQTFVMHLNNALYKWNQKYHRPIVVVYEEADMWAPQKWDRVTKPVLISTSKIALRGRKLGISPIFICPRPAEIAKTPLNESNVRFFGHLSGKEDVRALEWYLKGSGIEPKDLESLDVGEFIVKSKLGTKRIRVRPRLTPHGADTPVIKPVPATPQLKEAVSSLAKVIEEAVERSRKETSTITQLRMDVARREKTIQDQAREIERLKAALEVAGIIKIEPQMIGDLSAIKRELDEKYGVMISRLEEEVRRLKVASGTPAAPLASVPTVPQGFIKDRSSVANSLRELLQSEYCYVKMGLTLREIMEVLRENAIPHNPHNVSNWLWSAAKRGELARRRDGFTYRYWKRR